MSEYLRGEVKIAAGVGERAGRELRLRGCMEQVAMVPDHNSLQTDSACVHKQLTAAWPVQLDASD